MAVAGSLTYDTNIDKSGFEKGLNSLKKSTNTAGGQIKSILSALGIGKLISKAFSVINSSMDGAISRLDTLNNYPKVMSNLGIASEDAQKSINKMSDKLSGLPTTLDAGAMAVQRFTSANGNIKKSTDYFLALNNAILAGGASADIQSTAMEQLSQAYAKGKPDMMEWRSLMTAMPAQLKQVATAMGYVSTDKLGEDLRNGKVSMDEFMDTIVKLNTKGVAGFQSFEEQAKNSTGGIKTSITVAKTQIIKGVADIIKALDESLKNAGLGGIGEIIANIGKKAKEALDKVAGLIKKIDWKKVLDIIKAIIPVLGTLVSGFLAMQVIESVNGFIEKTIQGVNRLGKAIQLLMAHPVIAIITAVIAVLIILYQKCEAFRNAVNEAFSQLKNALMSAWEKLKPSLQELWDALKELFEALKPVGEFLMTVLVVAIKVLAKVLTALIPIITQIVTIVVKVVTKIIHVVTDVINAIVNFFTVTIPEAFQFLKDKISEIGNGIKQFFINLWNGIVEFFTVGIPNFIQSIIQWIQNLPYNIGLLIGTILGHIYNFAQSVWNWITVDLPKIIQSIIDWFAQLPDRILDWLVNTLTNIMNWAINVYNTANAWMSNTINSIISWFSQLPGRIWTWLLNTINNVISWGRNMAQKGQEGAKNLFDNIVNTIMNLPSRMMEIGRNIVEGLWNGIKNAESWMFNKVGEFARGVLDGMKNALGIHSPSTLFRDQVGKFIPQGIAVGIEADTDEALKAIDNMNNDIMNEMNKAVAFETGSINANASVKSNNSMLNVIQATFNIDGSVDMDSTKVGRLTAPSVCKTIKAGGLA